MKALQYAEFGGPEVLHIVERPQPVPGPNDVVVRVHAATVGIGDCKTRAGALQHFFTVSLPKTPGRYGSGVISALGDGVTRHRIGEAVVFATLHTQSGSAAAYVTVGAGQIATKPGNLDHLESAAFIQGAAAAYACLVQTAQLRRGEHVLIHGAAGSVGSACMELARHLGATVTATCRAPDRDYVRSLGADHIAAFDEEDFASRIHDQDVVVDLIGGDVHRRSYVVLKPGGRLVYLNAAPIEKRQDAGVAVLQAVIDNSGAMLDTVCRLAESGVFAPRLGKAVPLADGAEAHRLLESGAIKRGRIVLQLV